MLLIIAYLTYLSVVTHNLHAMSYNIGFKLLQKLRCRFQQDSRHLVIAFIKVLQD